MKQLSCSNIYSKVILVLFLMPSNSIAQQWEAPYNFNTIVFDLYPDTIDNLLYVGGQYRYIDSIYKGNITAYDGQEFHFMLPGMNACWNGGCEGVSTITRYKGEIIASLVRSDNYESTPQVIGIGRWNGQEWLPMGGGVADIPDADYYFPVPAYDFFVADDTLFAAGYFEVVDSVFARAVAGWDGTDWRTYPTTPPSQSEGLLSTCVAKYKNELYVGGNFDLLLNGERLIDLMKYNGTNWKKVGNGLKDGWTNLHDLEVFQGKLYVAGFFTTVEGNVGNSIMSWDGSHWDDLGGGVCSPGGAIDDLFVYEDKLYVAGYFQCIGGIPAQNLATWDGVRWCSVGNSTFNRAIHAVAVWRDTIYVGGSFFEIDSMPATYFARYVGDHSTDVCSDPVVSSPTPPGTSTSLQLSPNPVGDVLQLAAGENVASVQVWDVYGRVLEGLKPELQGAGVALDVSRLPAGWYVLGLRTDSGWRSAKFVKN